MCCYSLRRQAVAVLILVGLWVPGARAQLSGPAADSCSIPKAVTLVRPDKGGEPTRVKVGIFVIDLIGVEEVSESFEIDFRYTSSWRDPRLSAAVRGSSLEDCRVGIDEVWNAEIDALNRRKIEMDPTTDVDVDADGNVVFETRVVGTFSASLDLRDFPVDEQELRIRLASLEYGPDEVILETDAATTGRLPGLSLGGWQLLDSFSNVPEDEASGLPHARLDHAIVVKRQLGFYVWKVFVPMTFIVLMAWTVFWLDPENFAPQIGVATASVFTLIAFLLSLRQFLPRVSYLTVADQVILGMTTLVFLALGEVILTSRLAQRKRIGLARRIDFHARWVYLLLFALVLLALG